MQAIMAALGGYIHIWINTDLLQVPYPVFLRINHHEKLGISMQPYEPARNHLNGTILHASCVWNIKNLRGFKFPRLTRTSIVGHSSPHHIIIAAHHGRPKPNCCRLPHYEKHSICAWLARHSKYMGTCSSRRNSGPSLLRPARCRWVYLTRSQSRVADKFYGNILADRLSAGCPPHFLLGGRWWFSPSNIRYRHLFFGAIVSHSRSFLHGQFSRGTWTRG